MNGSLAERLAVGALAIATSALPPEDGLGSSTRAVLRALSQHDTLPLKDVAAAAGIAKSTASGLVDQLCAAGLVARERDTRDARRLALRLAPAGHAALAAAPMLAPARLEAALAALAPEDAELLANLSERVAEALGAQPAPATPLAGEPEPAAASPASPAGERRLLVVLLDGATYGLPVAAVREVLPYRAPRSLASESPWLDGVITVRGSVLAVSDLRRQLGLPGAAEPEALVVVEGASGPVGLAVDRVAELRTVRSGTLHPPLGGSARGVAGIVDEEGDLLVVLDPAPLLAG